MNRRLTEVRSASSEPKLIVTGLTRVEQRVDAGRDRTGGSAGRSGSDDHADRLADGVVDLGGVDPHMDVGGSRARGRPARRAAGRGGASSAGSSVRSAARSTSAIRLGGIGQAQRLAPACMRLADALHLLAPGGGARDRPRRRRRPRPGSGRWPARAGSPAGPASRSRSAAPRGTPDRIARTSDEVVVQLHRLDQQPLVQACRSSGCRSGRRGRSRPRWRA